MQPVIDVIHFSALVKATGKGRKLFYSNCLLLPPDISNYTRQHRILWEMASAGLFFLCEEQDFYYLYFYLYEQPNQPVNLRLEILGKPAVVNLVYLESNKPQCLFEIEEFWRWTGFQNHKIYRRMSLQLPLENSLFTNQELAASDYFIDYAHSIHTEDIQRLWRTSLDIFSTALPDKSDLLEMINKKQILCAFDRDNTLAGALLFQDTGKVCMFKHFAVDEKHRGHKLGRHLLHFYMADHKEIDRFILWVDENNLPALNRYTKDGFAFDGKVTNQLILKN